uniref:Arabidopsis retrotransposon Orf1 C-terminal domain-containing protein n=1 Tax=Noccaea caerulescens TaxID=107243 RepID=A0A1J3IJ78_NOCCA
MVHATRSGRKTPDVDEAERARREKREGKKIAVEKKGASSKRKAAERADGSGGAERVIRKPYDNQDRLDILRKMTFLPMRFPHEGTMRELGIFDEVQTILEGMEIHRFMELAPPAYLDPTLHFLATLKVVKHPALSDEIKKDGPGYITFALAHQPFRMGIKEIEELYGFDVGRGFGAKMLFEKEELARLWETISSSKYQVSSLRGGHIRSPAIRYAHKAIAHTMFARHECSNVHKGELEMLDIALTYELETLADGTKMGGDRSCDMSMAMVMLDSFQRCMKNAIVSYEHGKIKDSFIGLGSMVTPILLASGFPLPQPSHQPEWMDIAYLNKSWFLRGKSQEKHVYRFIHPSFGISKVLLPNSELTSFGERDNMVFLPNADALYMDGGDATLMEEEGPSEEHIQGDTRFHFDPYDASTCVTSVRTAHAHIKLLQEWCKWQDKTIKKFVSSVKKLKEKVKRRSASRSPTSDTSGGSSSSSP